MGKTTLRNPRLAAKVAKKAAKPARKPTAQQQLDQLNKTLKVLLKNQQHQNCDLHGIRADLIELRELLRPQLFDVDEAKKAAHRAHVEQKPKTRFQRVLAWCRARRLF